MESWLVVLVGTVVASVAMLAVLAAAVLRLRPLTVDASTTTARAGRRPSPAGPLLQGFGYLGAPLSGLRRRAGVTDRLERAFARVGGVDPYVAPRRVGMALLQAGLVDGADIEVQPNGAPRAPAATDQRRTGDET